MAWLETIKEWFEQEEPESDLIIDEKWNMSDLNGEATRFAVSNENLPFEIGVYVNREFAHISVYSNLETANWDVKDQRDIYHDLLIQNNKDLFAKYYLMGDMDTVAVRTEVDLEYFNKKEFNDALQAVILGSMWLLRKMGLLDESSCEVSEEELLENRILKMLAKGQKKHEIISCLIENDRMDPETATEIVFNLAKQSRDREGQ